MLTFLFCFPKMPKKNNQKYFFYAYINLWTRMKFGFQEQLFKKKPRKNLQAGCSGSRTDFVVRLHQWPKQTTTTTSQHQQHQTISTTQVGIGFGFGFGSTCNNELIDSLIHWLIHSRDKLSHWFGIYLVRFGRWWPSNRILPHSNFHTLTFTL